MIKKKKLSSSTCRRHVVPMHMRILRGILSLLPMCEHCKCERHNMATFPTCRSSISRSSRAFLGRRSSPSSASALAIRISLVGAFCIGSLGLAFKTSFTRSHPLLPLLRYYYSSLSLSPSLVGIKKNGQWIVKLRFRAFGYDPRWQTFFWCFWGQLFETTRSGVVLVSCYLLPPCQWQYQLAILSLGLLCIMVSVAG